MTIKKPFQELVSFLQSNQDATVGDILEDIVKLCEAKVQTQTSVKDAEGNVIGIFCYYHKRWENVEDVEYGKKATSNTGLNTMCKEGVRGWTRQQKLLKDVKERALEKMLSGDFDKDKAEAFIERANKQLIAKCQMDYAHDEEDYTTLEELEELAE